MMMNNPSGAENPGKARVFFALWPDPVLRLQLHDLSLQYQKRCGGRVMRPETLHLTLLFLGQIERVQLEALEALINDIRFAPFSFCLGQFAIWPHHRIACAAPVEEVPELGALTAALRRAAENMGMACDKRRFTPHVTLLRHVERTAIASSPLQAEWRVEAFSLVESVARASGTDYRMLKTWRGLG